MSPDPSSGVVPLRLVQRVELDLARAQAALADGAATWLGARMGSGVNGGRRFLTDLSLPVRDHAPAMTFHKAAFVDLGEPRLVGDRLEVEIGWRSSTLAPLFPVFAGTLSITRHQITLEGYYAPPGGDVGLVLDRAFLGIAARGTARWFLDHVTRSLTVPGHAPARQGAPDAPSVQADAEPAPWDSEHSGEGSHIRAPQASAEAS